MTARAVSTTLLLALFATSAPARAPRVSDDLIYRPVSISLIPPISTNWLSARRVKSNLSLNLVGGRLGRLEGVELGALYNSVREDIIGVQAAFGGNACGGSVTGAQLGFGASVADGAVRGIQCAFGATFAGSGLSGVQLAFGAAVSDGRVAGLQSAFGATVADGDITGAQICTGVNVTGGDLHGAQLGSANICSGQSVLQLGFLNAAGRSRLAQLGFVNIADRVEGIQVGFVNIAERSDWSFGFISVAKDGRFDFCLETGDAPLGAVALKAGTRRVYNVFTLGYTPADSAHLFTGIGIGIHFSLNRFFIDCDITTQSAFSGPKWFSANSNFGMLTRIRPTVGYRLTPWLALAAGPSIAHWRSDDEDGSAVALYDLPLWTGAAPYRRLWPGFTIGLQVTPGVAE